MFRVEFFCDDKRLAHALTSLAGIAMNLKVEPVVNAKKGRNGLKAETSGAMLEMFAQRLKDQKVDTFKGTICSGLCKGARPHQRVVMGCS